MYVYIFIGMYGYVYICIVIELRIINEYASVTVDDGWMDCVKNDMKIKGVSMEMTSDRWKKKTCCADPT
jgi:hypothetical protein